MMIAYFDIRNEFSPTASVNTQTETRTLEFISPNVLRCHCAEYRANHFCLHLVYFTAAKIRAFQESHGAVCETEIPSDDCPHANMQGDNYTLTCLDCGAIMETV